MLNACQSATRDPRNFVWTGVAPALLRAKVPAVVAMQFSISDDTAIVFAKNFYKVLSAGLPLDAAVAYGRRAIMDREEDERDQDWGVPVLYLRSEEGVIFPELATRSRRRKERNQYYHELFGEEYPVFSDRLRKPSQGERGAVWLKELLAGIGAFFKRLFARIKKWFWGNG